MIGQSRLKEQIESQLEKGKYPSFSIYVGPKGCGKKTLINELMQPAVSVSTNAEGIREMIECAYTSATDCTYVIPDADNMSQSAYNAMLKVVEDTPKHARFILTCVNIMNIPTTIRSRAVTYQFDPYTFDELCDFGETIGVEITQFIADTAETPGDILLLAQYEDTKFEDFVKLVIDNVASVSGANAFKIAEKIDIKGDDETKFDLSLFFRAFSSVCVNYMLDRDVNNCLKFSKAVAITGDVLADLNIKSVNRGMLFDKWLLDIRSEWM